MDTSTKIAVFISGRGSNLQALINTGKNNIVCVISSSDKAKGLSFAEAANIPYYIVKRSPESENHINEILFRHEVKLICLAGFMRILSEDFVLKWKRKILNIHPSILPSFAGVDVHERVLEAGVRVSGCTIHYVDSGVDSGEIILQGIVPVLDTDDVESLAARVLKMEHFCYQRAIDIVLGADFEKYVFYQQLD